MFGILGSVKQRRGVAVNPGGTSREALAVRICSSEKQSRFIWGALQRNLREKCGNYVLWAA